MRVWGFALWMMWAGADDASLRHGNALFSEQRYEEALQAYLDQLGSATEKGPLWFNIGTTYLALGELERAQDHFMRARSSNLERVRDRALFNLGLVQLMKGDAAGAVKSYAEYLRLHADDEDARRNLEIALRKAKETSGDALEDMSSDQNRSEESASSGAQDESGQKDNGADGAEGTSSSSPSQGDSGTMDPEPDPDTSLSDGSPSNPDPVGTQPSDPSASARNGESQTMDRATMDQVLKALQDKEARQLKAFHERRRGREARPLKDW